MAARDEEEFRRKKKNKVKEIGGKWPSVKPKKDLKINRLKSTNLFTISNFLTAYEAKTFIEVAESIGFTHQGSLGPTKGEAYRDNDRISVIDPFLAESLWESGLKKVFDDIQPNGKAAVGLNPNIRFYRYKVGQKFGRHIDESVDLEQGARTYYTLLVYLSGSISPKGKTNPGNNDSSMQPLVGGETVFYDKKLGVVSEVTPLEGMALLHLHGANCMLHEARIVTKGIKYVLRSDVAFA
ncbi:hypothetical protein IEQ34_014512 [Dendrobium chrysotoxum]|uniref:Fe2OG dioxygenase domain-containing protein n=1 Tax=Dendrobium chrysotoxum TaxID=161865 RepID=A0AAV7GLI3_DENCH|nr:hypothetical protein IEQ34_014512 [Dendrobium chrysotoxum]